MRSRRGVVFALGIDYAGSAHEPLSHLAEGVPRLLAHFVDAGFVPHPECHTLGAMPTASITGALEVWCDEVRAAGETSSLVVYIGGHGRVHFGSHYVLSADSPLDPPYSSTKALSATDLVQFILNSCASSCVVLIDSCFAGVAANQIQAALDRATADSTSGGTDIAVLVAALHRQHAYSGLFINGFLDALCDGSWGRFWRDGDEFVTVLELRDELRHRFDDAQTAFTSGRDGIKLPNPRYRSTTTDRPVEIGNFLNDLPVDAQRHFVGKASGSDPEDVGWYFTGRAEPSAQIATWIKSTHEGVCVVTGAPGSGKSALLGRMAVLADRGSQRACQILGLHDDPAVRPPVGAFDAVIHLKGLRSPDVARAIACELKLPEQHSVAPVRDLVAALADSGRGVTILADGLDEAASDEMYFIARDILRAIGSLPGCKVLVGTRRDIDGRDISAFGDVGPLLETLRPRLHPMTVIDLQADPMTEEDIAEYVARRLSEDPSWALCGSDELSLVSEELACQAAGIFMYARCGVRALKSIGPGNVDFDDVGEQLAALVGDAGLNEVFAQDLARTPDPELVVDAFTALALSSGRGLPRREIWPALTTTIAAKRGSANAYSNADIARVVRETGWYLVEGTEHGEAVFRLYHQSLADYLVSQLS
jgi:hypothetical protein